jgi:integrase
MVMVALYKRMKREGITTHGFRSTFRDWAGEATHYPREICEAALAHAVGNAVEQAYRRGDALEKRRALMADWAAYCSGATSAKVVNLTAKRGRRNG